MYPPSSQEINDGPIEGFQIYGGPRRVPGISKAPFLCRTKQKEQKGIKSREKVMAKILPLLLFEAPKKGEEKKKFQSFFFWFGNNIWSRNYIFLRKQKSGVWVEGGQSLEINCR